MNGSKIRLITWGCAWLLVACSRSGEAPAPTAEACEDDCGSCAEGSMCGEHRLPEAECGICQPGKIAALKVGESLKVRLPAPDSAKLVSLICAKPTPGAVQEELACLTDVSIHPDGQAVVRAPVSGILEGYEVMLGARVRAGEIVARLRSPDVATLRSSLTQAAQRLKREEEVAAKGLSTAQELEEARAAVARLTHESRALGIDEASSADQDLLLLRAPLDGEAAACEVSSGSRVTAGDVLARIEDPRRLRLLLHVPAEDMANIRVGQQVSVLGKSPADVLSTGRILRVTGGVDARTRLPLVEADLEDATFQVRPGAMLRARVHLDARRHALRIPAEAVQFVGDIPLVFVRIEEDLYEARRVELGVVGSEGREIRQGLAPQDAVVVRQAPVVKSQLLASRLGAGCADD